MNEIESQMNMLVRFRHFLYLIEVVKKFFLYWLDQRNQLLKRHKATEQACEIRPHHLSIVQMANKREMDVS